MNIDDLTIGQIKQIQAMTGGAQPSAPEVKRKVILRTYSAGVFYGDIVARRGREVDMENVIRLWQWSGACSLSQLAVDGTSNPGECKFSVAVSKETLLEGIEILDTSNAAQKSIEGVAPWKK